MPDHYIQVCPREDCPQEIEGHGLCSVCGEGEWKSFADSLGDSGEIFYSITQERKPETLWEKFHSLVFGTKFYKTESGRATLNRLHNVDGE